MQTTDTMETMSTVTPVAEGTSQDYTLQLLTTVLKIAEQTSEQVKMLSEMAENNEKNMRFLSESVTMIKKEQRAFHDSVNKKLNKTSQMTSNSTDPTSEHKSRRLVPTIKINTHKTDREGLTSKGGDHWIEKLNTQGGWYRHISTAHFEKSRDQLWLTVDCYQAYEALNKGPLAGKIPGILELHDDSTTKRDEIWVLVCDWRETGDETAALKRNPASYLGRWKKDTGFKIAVAQFRARYLIWRFQSVNDAKRACKAWFKFLDAMAWAR